MNVFPFTCLQFTSRSIYIWSIKEDDGSGVERVSNSNNTVDNGISSQQTRTWGKLP